MMVAHLPHKDGRGVALLGFKTEPPERGRRLMLRPHQFCFGSALPKSFRSVRIPFTPLHPACCELCRHPARLSRGFCRNCASRKAHQADSGRLGTISGAFICKCTFVQAGDKQDTCNHSSSPHISVRNTALLQGASYVLSLAILVPSLSLVLGGWWMLLRAEASCRHARVHGQSKRQPDLGP